MRRRKPELSLHYERLVEMLGNIGILESYRDGGGQAGLRLTELGKLFEDETLALFFQSRGQRGAGDENAE